MLYSPGQLAVKNYPDGTHSLVKTNLEDSELMSTLVAVVAPRSLFVPGYLADRIAFLEGIVADGITDDWEPAVAMLESEPR